MSIIDNTYRVIDEYNRRVKRGLIIAGEIASTYAKKEAGFDTGDMRRRIYVTNPESAGTGFILANNGWGIKVISPNDYSAYQEFGPVTGKRNWKFKPFMRPATDYVRPRLEYIIKKSLGGS